MSKREIVEVEGGYSVRYDWGDSPLDADGDRTVGTLEECQSHVALMRKWDRFTAAGIKALAKGRMYGKRKRTGGRRNSAACGVN